MFFQTLEIPARMNSTPLHLSHKLAESVVETLRQGEVSGGIFVSTDFGANWALSSAPSNSWGALTSSADGSRLAAAAVNGGIYISGDSGSTWRLSAAPNSNSWAAITGSADRGRIVAFDNSTNAWYSIDAGRTWQPSLIGAGFAYGAACSADGLRIAVVYGVSDIYFSRDGGVSWLPSHVPSAPWRTVAASAPGNFIAAAYGVGIDASRDSTTTGTKGFLSGGAFVAVELQYVGNGQFLPINHEGTLITH